MPTNLSARAGFPPRLRSPLPALAFSLTLAVVPSLAHAGDFFGRNRRPAPAPASAAPLVPTSATVVPGSVNNYGRLGSFYPTPYIMVRGNAPTGGGYTPLNGFGDDNLSLYGPLSALRSTSAPVQTYTRGYDGRTVVTQGTSFSTPNLPALTPVIYPTQASYYYGFKQTGTPPWWSSGINWIDQN